MKDLIQRDGITYISTKSAAELTGYTRDYVGQLAREGYFESTKVGRSRFVAREGLKNYLKENNSKKYRKAFGGEGLDEAASKSGDERQGDGSDNQDNELESADSSDEEKNTEPTKTHDTESGKSTDGNPVEITIFSDEPDTSSQKYESKPTEHDGVVDQQGGEYAMELLSGDQKKHPSESVIGQSESRLRQKTLAVLIAIVFTFGPYLFAHSPFAGAAQERAKHAIADIQEVAMITANESSEKIRKDGFIGFLKGSVSGSGSFLAEEIDDQIASVGLQPRSSLDITALLNTLPGKVDYLRQATGSVMHHLAELFAPREIVEQRNDAVTYADDDNKVGSIQQGEGSGMVVMSSSGNSQVDRERIEYAQKVFSDDVEITHDESGTRGIVRPIFKDAEGDDYLYVMVPVNEERE